MGERRVTIVELDGKLNYLITEEAPQRVHGCRSISALARAMNVPEHHLKNRNKSLKIRENEGRIPKHVEEALAAKCSFDPNWTAWRTGTRSDFKHKYEQEVIRPRNLLQSEQNASSKYLDFEVFQDEEFAPEIVVLPKGSFKMGSSNNKKYPPSERPQHDVTIARRFAVGRWPITFSEWDFAARDGAFSGFRATDNGWGRENRPAIYISWLRAREYTKWLSAKVGETYRLLSEAEWEYACRAGSEADFSFGDAISATQSKYDATSKGMTAQVGLGAPNAFGLYDMHGNVWEWCADAWHGSYDRAPADGSSWQCSHGDGRLRVVRGGSWRDPPDLLRSASRHAKEADWGFDCVGFRVAREIDQEE